MSYGQKMLSDVLSVVIKGKPIENYRPDWLFGKEIDFFYPEWNLGFEFQGDQHFVPVFGLKAAIAQRMRDKEKRRICLERGTILVQVEARELELKKMIRKLWAHICMKRPDWTKGQRKAWLKMISNKPPRGLRKRFVKRRMAYCRNLECEFGPLPTVHAPNTKIRKKISTEIWQSARIENRPSAS